MSVALMTPNTYATTANQFSSENITTSNNISHLNIENQKSDLIQNTTTSGLKPSVKVSETGKNQIKNVHRYFNNTINNLYYNQNDSNTIQYAIAAAGDESSSNVHITTQKILEAAGKVKAFIDVNHKLPNFVQIGNTPVTMPEFLQLLTTSLIQINNNNINTITLKSADKPTTPTENMQNGTIPKTEYLELANKIKSFMETTGKAPNYATSTLGKIRYESLIYTYSRIMDYYHTKTKLPNYVTIEPWETTDTAVTDDLDKYLQSTANCQSTNSAIITLANSLTINKTTTYAKAVAIFDWVSDNISYSFYYNSVKGALSTLNSKTANCCDTTHLLIALMRASGIPARYLHGTCTFSDGTFGHVFAQVYVGNTWYYADAISNKNTFGSINNWNLNTYTLHGIYSSLPF